jgi:hypothetical protein
MVAATQPMRKVVQMLFYTLSFWGGLMVELQALKALPPQPTSRLTKEIP